MDCACQSGCAQIETGWLGSPPIRRNPEGFANVFASTTPIVTQAVAVTAQESQ
jgi:hypothetical protein